MSDIIVTGDIQMTGDGEPYVLMSECQTMGGYPRIGTVIPADLPVLAQAKAGTPIRFEQITLEQADNHGRPDFCGNSCQPDYPRLCAILQRSAICYPIIDQRRDHRLRGLTAVEIKRGVVRNTLSMMLREQSPYAVQPDHRMLDSEQTGSLIQT